MAMNPRLLRPKVGGPFTPKSVSGLALWLDASDSGTLGPTSAGPGTVSNNGPVKYWGDKSGNNRHATQTGADSAAPTYLQSSNALSFDGGDFLRNTSSTLNTTNSTMFAVFRIATQGSAALMAVHQPTGSDWNTVGAGIIFVNGSSTYINSGAIQFAGPAYSVVDGLLNINIAPTNNAALYLRRGGADSTASDTSYASAIAATAYVIGARITSGNVDTGNAMVGRIYEVLWYNAALAASDQLKVRAYLQTKWAIA